MKQHSMQLFIPVRGYHEVRLGRLIESLPFESIHVFLEGLLVISTRGIEVKRVFGQEPPSVVLKVCQADHVL